MQSEESIFLDLQKIGLGAITELDEKKKYLETVQLEKQKIQVKMLRNIYDNAFEFYKDGDYEEAKELSSRILSIDPGFRDASMLMEASRHLGGSPRPLVSEKLMIEDRFKYALALYTEGRIVEAHDKMEEVVKLSPNNIKARHWLDRIKDDLTEFYFNRGMQAYSKGSLKEALDNYYNALLIRPKERKIIQVIAKTEEELRNEQAKDKLKEALENYSQGKLIASYNSLRKVLEIQPSDAKASRLLNDVRVEIERGYISAGRNFYGQRKYIDAISEWEKAKPYTTNTAYVDKLVSRAKEQIKLEAEERKRKAEEAARRAKEEEERKKKEEEERQRALKAQKQPGMPVIEKPQGISEENRMASQQHYLEGLKHFQNSNYAKARDEWTIAKQLDPGNADAEAGLKRIEQILSGGQ
ncbi:MAG: hypothetical protein HY746_04395 [Elusimicrobia bacterium]|nr:hypothetical protein [Elusimicrobiota bacterium]